VIVTGCQTFEAPGASFWVQYSLYHFRPFASFTMVPATL